MQKYYYTTIAYTDAVRNNQIFASSSSSWLAPPSDIQISVIVMNHARPHLLQHSQLLPVLVRHPSVSEILILHSDPATAFTNQQLAHLDDNNSNNSTSRSNSINKIQHVDASALNREVGLAVRFHYCATHCHNDWVLHVDDDMEMDATAVNALIQHMMIHSKRIVGHYGRRYSRWRAPHRHGYDTTHLLGPRQEVVLTKILILEREVCRQFVRHAPLVEHDLVLPQSQPRWNGEDIFVNLVANHYYKVPLQGPYQNYAIPNLPVWEANLDEYAPHAAAAAATNNNNNSTTSGSTSNNKAAVSGNIDRTHIWKVGPVAWWRAYLQATKHTRFRGRLWATAKERLAALDD